MLESQNTDDMRQSTSKQYFFEVWPKKTLRNEGGVVPPPTSAKKSRTIQNFPLFNMYIRFYGRLIKPFLNKVSSYRRFLEKLSSRLWRKLNCFKICKVRIVLLKLSCILFSWQHWNPISSNIYIEMKKNVTSFTVDLPKLCSQCLCHGDLCHGDLFCIPHNTFQSYLS